MRKCDRWRGPISCGIVCLLLMAASPVTAQVNQQWAARHDGAGTGEDRGHAITTDAEGNVYVAGQSSPSGSAMDFVTIKYDAYGVQQWLRTYNGPGNDEDFANDIVVDEAGNAGRSHLSSSRPSLPSPWTCRNPSTRSHLLEADEKIVLDSLKSD